MYFQVLGDALFYKNKICLILNSHRKTISLNGFSNFYF